MSINEGITMKRAALYARVSTEHQTDTSIETQLKIDISIDKVGLFSGVVFELKRRVRL